MSYHETISRAILALQSSESLLRAAIENAKEPDGSQLADMIQKMVIFSIRLERIQAAEAAREGA